MKTLLMTISICSVLWLAGCATEKSEKSSVARTLDSYQVGTTTFADFKHDSRLIEGQKTVDAAVLNSTPQQTAARVVYTYDVPRHSNWRIFETHDNTSVTNGTVVARDRQLTVGTRSHRLYTLRFNSAGILVDKRPVS